MTLGLTFWICMLIYLLFSGWSSWPDYKSSGSNLLLFVILLLLGWHSFGPPIHG